MKHLLVSWLLCLSLSWATPLVAQTFPPIVATSPEIPGNNIDEDDDGTYDEAPTTSIVLDTDVAGQYHWHFKNCDKTVWANIADDTFPDDVRVEKPVGSLLNEGQIVCYIANLPAATYTLHIFYSTPTGTRAIWPAVNKSLSYQLPPENASILPFTNTPQWQQLVYTGSAANYYAGENGGSQVSFVHAGGVFALVFKGDDARYACGYLATTATPTLRCPNETSTSPALANYEILEVNFPTEAIPTAWNSAAFTNANVMQFTGTEAGSVCGGVMIVKMLWDNAATDRGYLSINCADTEAVVLNTANEFGPGGNEDQFDFRFRGDQSATLDTNAYMVVGNLHPVYFDADWSGASNARNSAVNLNTTVVKNVVASTSWNLFIAFDLGSDFAADTVGLCQGIMIDRDAATLSSKYFHGISTSVSQWGTCKWSSTAVAASGGGGDVTAPVVTSPAIPSGTIEQTSFIMTAATNEAGTCRVRYGLTSGSHTWTTSGTPSVNGTCTVSVTGLDPDTVYHADMQVTDAANNPGDSTEVGPITTDGTGSVCTKFAGPTAQGSANGSSDANRYLPSGFWGNGHAVPGAVLCLASGTYKGAASMITPTPGINGNALAPITIKSTTDGGAWIHGEDVRRPVTLNNNDFWILEGFDASNSHISAVSVGGTGASNNIVRRVCAWNAVPAFNERVWGITASGTNNLFEDVCGFGTNRRIFAITQGGNSTIIRRAWAVFEKTGGGGPEAAYQFAYSGENHVLENVIGTWKQTVAGDSTGAEKGLLHLANEGQNHKLLGSLFYVRSGDSFSPGTMAITSWAAIPHGPFELRDVIMNTEQSKRPYGLAGGGTPCTNCTVTNSTEIGGTVSSIHANWTQSNRRSYADMTAANADDANPFQSDGSTTRARMCFKYGNPSQPFVGGVLTSTKLWPWPMDSRINAALVRAGKTPSDYLRGSGATVTSEVEFQFGTIPAGCKS
jgi:hypothetical protein